MVAGPGIGGVAVAHAGIFGIGPDLLDPSGCGDKKSDMHHPRPGSDSAVSAQSTASPATNGSSRTTASVAPTAKIGSQPETLAASQAVADNRAFAGAVGDVGAVESNLGGGGGGPARTSGAATRAGNLPLVSTAPVTRSIVIRGTPREAGLMPGSGASSLPEAPVVAPLAAPPPVSPDAEALPAPGAPPAPTITVPQAKEPWGQHGPGAVPIPDSYRAGYAEYLRAADTSDLVEAALPGVAGIAGFTLIGAYAGYRQARAVQKALLAPVPTSILL